MVTCFRGNPEEFYGEVLLLNGRKITLMGERGVKRSSRAAAILDHVLSQLQVEEAEFFGLKFSDNKQQTHWLDLSKTISQHRALVGPPYIFYFGVKFYVEDPSKLRDETTRSLFYLQVRQDVIRGHLPCPAHLRPRLFALMLQADGGDHEEPREAGPVDDGQEEPREAGPVDDGQEHWEKIEQIYKSLRGVRKRQCRKLKKDDYDSADEDSFTLESRGYLYEPEFTEEELLKMETNRLKGKQRKHPRTLDNKKESGINSDVNV